jgi:mono/diheme cytochrome c family protein
LNLLPALAQPTNTAVSREYRVRSYLAANCRQCHQPGGTALGLWDARITTPTASAGLIQGALINNGGDGSNRVIVPGDLPHSTLLARISVRGTGQMPPLGSSLVDTQGVQLLTDWITNDLPGYSTNTSGAWPVAFDLRDDTAFLTFPHAANRGIEVQTATNLSPAALWRTLDAPFNAPFFPSETFLRTIELPTTEETRFFRIRAFAP